MRYTLNSSDSEPCGSAQSTSVSDFQMVYRVLWDICLHSVKTSHCDWLNKELNGQQLGRREQAGFFQEERELWEEAKGSCQ